MAGLFTWTAIATIIALFAAFIQERKLSFDLFNRRFEAYTIFRNATYEIYNDMYMLKENKFTYSEIQKSPFPDLYTSQQLLKLLFPSYIGEKTDHTVFILRYLLKNKIQILSLEKSADTIAIYDSLLHEFEVSCQNDLSILDELVYPYLRQKTVTESIYENYINFINKVKKLWSKRPFQKQ